MDKSDGYGQVVSKGVRVSDDDVAKGMNRQSVMPVIARVNPQKSYKRVVTGDAVNARRVIGKSDVAKFSFKPLGGAVKSPRQFGAGLKSGWQQGRSGASALASPANAGGRTGMNIGRLAGRNPMQTGLLAGGLGAGGLMAGNGQRNRSQAPPPMMAPMGMYGGFGKLYTEHRVTGDKVEYRDDDGNRYHGKLKDHHRLPGQSKQVKSFTLGKDRFGKRSYDPEADRRYRQGAAAAATGIGGATLLSRGARDIRRDTKELRSIPQMSRRVIPPPLSENKPDGRPRNPKHVQARIAEIQNSKQHNARAAENAKKLKGVQVRGRSAGKVGAGLLLLGGSGALVRNRHEERWD